MSLSGLRHFKYWIRKNNWVVGIMVLASLGFFLFYTYTYISGYSYLVGNDPYRDYSSIQNYLLNNQTIPGTAAYHDRPLFYYFLAQLTLLTHWTLFEWFRIGIVLIFASTWIFYYLIYQRLFTDTSISILGATLTVLQHYYFTEMIMPRPNMMALALFPICAYLFIQLSQNKKNYVLLIFFLITLRILDLSHMFGTIAVGIFLLGLIHIYWQTFKKYYWLLLSIFGVVIMILIIMMLKPALLPATLAVTMQLVIDHNSEYFTNIGFSLRTIMSIFGDVIPVIAIAGLTLYSIDLIHHKHRESKQTTGMIIFALLTGFGLIAAWIAPYFNFGIFPIRMLIYIWIGFVGLAMYFLHRIQHPLTKTIVFILCTISLAWAPTKQIIYDSIYVIDKEPELLTYLENQNISEAIIITQATTKPLFVLNDNNYIILNNFDPINVKMMQNIFYGQNPPQVSKDIKKLLEINQLEDSLLPVYIVYSNVKHYNTSLWNLDGFRVQSLERANLGTFQDQEYFQKLFDNDDIELWEWMQSNEKLSGDKK